jgi:hypothetical protein
MGLALKLPVMYIMTALVLVFLFLVAWPCRYRLRADDLVIQAGQIHWQISYSQITRVEPTRSPFSSPAYSLDRLAITYGGKQIMISPERQQEFLKELADRATLKRDGNGLIR